MSIRIRIGMIGVVVYLLIVFLLGQENEVRAMLKARLETVASAGKITLEDTRLRRSFFDRVFRPAFEKAVSLIGTVLPLSGKAQAQLEEKLRKSGKIVSAREYLARQAVCGAALLGAELLLTDSVVKVAPSIRFMALLYTGVGYYILPAIPPSRRRSRSWRMNCGRSAAAARKRRTHIEAEIPPRPKKVPSRSLSISRWSSGGRRIQRTDVIPRARPHRSEWAPITCTAVPPKRTNRRKPWQSCRMW